MALVLYSREGVERLTAEPRAGDRCTLRLMGERSLSLGFTLSAYHEIEVGDYIDFEGVRYRILESYLPEMVSTIEYKYSLRLYDDTGYLRHAKVQKPAQADIELSFTYDARPHEHIRLVVDNLNRITASSDWVVGTVIDGTSENIEYANLFCLDALGAIAQKYKTEWWIEGRTINLCRCEHGTPIDLAYMQGLATGLTRTENSTARHFTRLYPLGSSRNIDPAKYGKSRLGLPHGRAYLERNIHLGVIEQSEETAFSHIYPRYTGTVSATRHETRHVEGKSFEVYYIADSALPFDPNAHELGGLVKHVVFQSGELNGRDFEANYNSRTKEWELITQHPYKNQSIPSGRLIPQVGDTYIPHNFRMPDEYVRRAERELETEAQQWLERISEDTSIYKARTDYIDIERRGLRLTLGQRVRLRDERYFAREGGSRLSRITSISQSLLYPTEMELECTYTVDTGRIAQIESGITAMRAAYREVQGSLPAILKSWDSTDPSEYNVLSALRAIETTRRIALRKDKDDSTAYAIGSESYVKGISGWHISPDGKAQFSDLKIAGVLEVDEFRRNRISILDGEHYFSSASATVAEVAEGAHRFRPQLEEGEMTSLVAGDYCIGKWVVGEGRVEVCKLRIEGIDTDGWVRYSLAESSTPPRVGMAIAQMGHISDKSRQRATVVRNNVLIQYEGVSGWEVRPEHISALYGDLEGFSIEPFGALRGSGAYIANAYISGRLVARSGDGTTEVVPVAKGEWTEGTIAHPHDRYTYQGRWWQWVGSSPTDKRPDKSLTGWIDEGATALELEQSISATRLYIEYSENGIDGWHEGGRSSDRFIRQKVGDEGVWSDPLEIRGEDALIVQVWSEDGTQFLNGKVSTTLYAFVYRGREEISTSLPMNAFRWIRISRNPDTDRIWNAAHTASGRSITITPEDVVRSAIFSVEIEVE